MLWRNICEYNLERYKIEITLATIQLYTIIKIVKEKEQKWEYFFGTSTISMTQPGTFQIKWI